MKPETTPSCHITPAKQHAGDSFSEPAYSLMCNEQKKKSVTTMCHTTKTFIWKSRCWLLTTFMDLFCFLLPHPKGIKKVRILSADASGHHPIPNLVLCLLLLQYSVDGCHGQVVLHQAPFLYDSSIVKPYAFM